MPRILIECTDESGYPVAGYEEEKMVNGLDQECLDKAVLDHFLGVTPLMRLHAKTGYLSPMQVSWIRHSYRDHLTAKRMSQISEAVEREVSNNITMPPEAQGRPYRRDVCGRFVRTKRG